MGGGHNQRPLERIGRLADGWIALGSAGPDVSTQIAAIRQASLASGRPERAVLIQGRTSIAQGNAEDWMERALGWKGLGADHMVVNTRGGGIGDVEKHLARAERFMTEVAPAI